jgi:pimeloyl-ACP methyl ester carboxylesterase
MPQPSLILVHGAATGAWVWDAWRRHLTPFGWEVNVLDLKGHGRSLPVDLSTTTMEDYVADLDSVCGQIEAARGAHPIVGGWSMGGLVAMMYAAQHPQTPGLLLFSPSQPLEVAGKASIEVQRRHPEPVLGPGAFGVYPEDADASREALFDLTDEELSRFLERTAGAQESGLAYRQRLRGISIPEVSIACPSLVVYGQLESGATPTQNQALAGHIKGESLCVPGAGHWGIVYSDALVATTAPLVDAWLCENFVDT